METDVLVVGAGLAGLTAARALADAGREVVLYDKVPRPGGRCATRTLAGATIDTGAQFFTVRSGAFAGLVERWTAEGCPIRTWSDGFARATSIMDGPGMASTDGDGHPRHSVAGGMNRLAAHLARDLDVRVSTRVTSVRRDRDAWALTALDPDGRAVTARAGAVLLTPPAPQTLALLGNGGVEVPRELAATLRDQDYEPCLTLLVALDRDPGLPRPGGVQFAGGPVGWLADNVAKGASTVPAVTVHASGDWSESFSDAEPDLVAGVLLDVVRPWLSGAEPVATEVVRWRYSKPRRPADVGALLVAREPGPLVVAGDALAGAKVEGAVTAGLAAAALL